MSCLRNIAATWMSVTMARRTIDAALSHYQAQVSEFAEELLVAQEYYKHYPDFWVNSGLVEHREMEESVFEAAWATSSNFDRLSATESAQQLYEAHSDLLSLLSPALAKAGFDAHLPEVLGWRYMHAVSEALRSPSRSALPEVVIKQEKTGGSKGKGKGRARG